MRLLHVFRNDREARLFSQFLKKEGIENLLDVVPNTDWGSVDYGTLSCKIWVIEEDAVDAAQAWLDLFLQNPNDSRFSKQQMAHPPTSIPQKPSSVRFRQGASLFLRAPQAFPQTKQMGVLTFYLILFCTILFFASQTTQRPYEPLPSYIPVIPIFSSPIKKALYYDYPEAYILIDKIVDAYGMEKLTTPQLLPQEGKLLLTQALKTPYWLGFYDKVVANLGPKHLPIQVDEPLFEKIRQGELWRLITPIFLHNDIFHLFFNMIWLLVLGMQIERRTSTVRYILFILLAGLFTNTCQYLMSGANFIGFSGVLCAMITFVWFRHRRAPWEGYQLLPSTMAFITLFVFAMLGIQLVSFVLQIYGQEPFAPPIANTAHLSGGLTGYVFSRLSFFAWKSNAL